jgi:hypothetical protein
VTDKRAFERQTPGGWECLASLKLAKKGDIIRGYESTGEAVAGFPAEVVGEPFKHESGAWAVSTKVIEHEGHRRS